MVRWEPGAPERLQTAALELFSTRGYEQTTASDIAAAVGLTERTFFRHYSDKREVLFFGQDEFVQAFLDGMAAAPRGAAAMAVVEAALDAAASLFPEARRRYAGMRQQVIDANPPLQERERSKLAGLAASIAGVLRARGVSEPAATLAAESGTTVFSIAFAQWIAQDEKRSLRTIVGDMLRQLSDVTAGRK